MLKSLTKTVWFQQFSELDRISHGADVVGQSVPGIGCTTGCYMNCANDSSRGRLSDPARTSLRHIKPAVWTADDVAPRLIEWIFRKFRRPAGCTTAAAKWTRTDLRDSNVSGRPWARRRRVDGWRWDRWVWSRAARHVLTPDDTAHAHRWSSLPSPLPHEPSPRSQ